WLTGHQPSIRSSIRLSMQGRASLLELDRCTSLFQRLLRGFGFFLGYPFLHGGRSAVYQGLGFFHTQTGQSANGLDDVHFLVPVGYPSNQPHAGDSCCCVVGIAVLTSNDSIFLYWGKPLRGS